MPEELMYQIALTRVPMVGDVIIKKLIEHFGCATDVFKAGKYELTRIETVGAIRASALLSFRDFDTIGREIAFMEKYGIQPVFCTDPAYPRRLLHCPDNPAMLYFKGNTDLNPARIVNIVGTRFPTAYGRSVCEALVNALAEAGVTIVSGLAYGIDILAHKAALKANTPTIGVLAHGLDRIYPPGHRQIAADMLEQGGLLTDYPSQTQPDRQNFPRRNRIVAGISDVTIVIESGIRGGSLITADLANGYNREVCCIPGRIQDTQSAGCNELIRQNKAVLTTSANDILDLMGWQEKPVDLKKDALAQPPLFPEFSADEQLILALFREKSPMHLEELYLRSRLSGSQVAVAVFNLEMHQVVKSLPGQQYELTAGW
ncbi:DNA-processing protein DprA [Chitinophaga sp. 212800010-3]|uniref:DNA-processing protein DprA n=1 Tax=unclassified Chitinophaga TaxID=2619133 RepID=UPI002DEABA7A|nr:DNA-protecting protein DprA [Chitinophaga sp. 212800010-3]